MESAQRFKFNHSVSLTKIAGQQNNATQGIAWMHAMWSPVALMLSVLPGNTKGPALALPIMLETLKKHAIRHPQKVHQKSRSDAVLTKNALITTAAETHSALTLASWMTPVHEMLIARSWTIGHNASVLKVILVIPELNACLVSKKTFSPSVFMRNKQH